MSVIDTAECTDVWAPSAKAQEEADNDADRVNRGDEPLNPSQE